MKMKLKLVLSKTLFPSSCAEALSIEHIGIKIEQRKGDLLFQIDRLPRQRCTFFHTLPQIDEVTETDNLSKINEKSVMETKDDIVEENLLAYMPEFPQVTEFGQRKVIYYTKIL